MEKYSMAMIMITICVKSELINITQLKIHHLYSFIILPMTWTLLILAVCMTSVTYELS